MDNWTGWPPSWPREERVLEGRQTCRRCGLELRGTVGRPTPQGWMHRNCAILHAANPATLRVVDALLGEPEESA